MRAAEQLRGDEPGSPVAPVGLEGGAPPPERAASGRPPTRLFRFFKAYWVTFVVIASYLSARLQARFRSEEAIRRVLERKHLRNARRIERAIVELQGLYIKVGQLISIMTNFLPPEFRRELEGLQDQVPPRPYEDIEARFREEFDGAAPDELFASFDRAPIASASIGQVHLATLPGGDKVAVKVQYPGIEEIVRSDLRTLRRIFRIVSAFVSYRGLEDVYNEVASMILEELDFRAEALNVDRVAQNFLDRHEICFPQVVTELSTARVLTTHFEEGIKVGDLARLDAAGIDRQALARLVVETYCQQIFTDGVYHADPHPGNVLVRRGQKGDDLTLVFLDFGAVAEIPPEMRRGIIELLQAAFARDTERIIRSMKQMGFIARGADDALFERVVEYFHERLEEQISLESLNLKDIKFDPQKSLEGLADLRKMDISIRDLTASFHVPKEWILLERTLLLLMGLCTALDPTMNPMTVIRPYLERFVLGAEGDWSSFVLETTKDLVRNVTGLPGDMRKLMGAARAGDLEVRLKDLGRSSRVFYRLGHQIILTAIGISGAAIAIVLEGRGDLERAEVAWWTMRIAGICLVWSWWTTRSLLRRR
jgi:predicted unusual protein kinase regulating ubiquinone biosynthesis (AarF/ABC1/UbiB family)